MISQSVVNMMMEMAILAFVIPVVLIAVWKMRTRKSLSPVFWGVGFYVTFAVLLQSVPTMYFVTMDNPISRLVKTNAWTYAIYAGLIAGIFEEVARYIAFRFFLPKHTDRETAISYGLGHAGIECMIVLGFTQLQNYSYAVMINSGQIDEMLASLTEQSMVDSLTGVIESVKSVSFSMCIWNGIEAAATIFWQIALSVIVFYAARYAKKIYLLIAVLLHALIVFPSTMYQSGNLSREVSAIIMVVYAIIMVVAAYRVYMTLPTTEKQTESTKGFSYANQKYKDIKSEKAKEKEGTADAMEAVTSEDSGEQAEETEQK